jgi:hypothetical protein
MRGTRAGFPTRARPVRIGRSKLGPYGVRIDNLLSMFLRPDFECLQQLANFILDRLIMRAIVARRTAPQGPLFRAQSRKSVGPYGVRTVHQRSPEGQDNISRRIRCSRRIEAVQRGVAELQWELFTYFCYAGWILLPWRFNHVAISDRSETEHHRTPATSSVTSLGLIGARRQWAM